jgi:mannonate dehydratase
MKLGFGLYRHQLDDEHFHFARQCGATHLVVHYVDYFNQADADNPAVTQPTGGLNGWGRAGDPDKLWSAEELIALRERVEAAGLILHAIENLDPAHWHDVLLAGPKRAAQLENVKTIIRNMGCAGIPVLGYNFSLAGVFGRQKGTFARAGAESVGLQGGIDQTPIPNGMVWNMWYEENAAPGDMPHCSHEDLWQRVRIFLDAVLPVAEEARVTLAAHPDDPPLEWVRSSPRLVYQPHLYQKLADLNPSRANQFEFCLGTLAEMSEGDIYQATESYAAQRRIAYVHFRNVRGKVPRYVETFIDDGDIDMPRLLKIFRRHGFEGVFIPDHTPIMSCPGGWYAGMAFAMGYMKRCLEESGGREIQSKRAETPTDS